MARKDKKRYQKAMEDYTPPSDDEEDTKSKKTTKKKKDPNAPKAAKNPYTYFCQANRPKLLEKHPQASFTEIVSNMLELIVIFTLV